MISERMFPFNNKSKALCTILLYTNVKRKRNNMSERKFLYKKLYFLSVHKLRKKLQVSKGSKWYPKKHTSQWFFKNQIMLVNSFGLKVKKSDITNMLKSFLGWNWKSFSMTIHFHLPFYLFPSSFPTLNKQKSSHVFEQSWDKLESLNAQPFSILNK